MIILYQFPSKFGLPNSSTFCMKVETFLRMAGLDYKTEVPPAFNRSAPKGKLPFIRDGEEIIPDSGFIVEHLTRKYRLTMDEGLSEGEKAEMHMLRRTFEESLQWSVMYFRWQYQPGWEIVKKEIFAGANCVMRFLGEHVMRRGLVSQIRAQGMGRHKPEEVAHLACQDLEAISVFLGDKHYFMGAEPRSVDATAFAFLANIIKMPLENPIKEFAMSRKNLVDYVDRMNARYYA